MPGFPSIDDPVATAIREADGRYFITGTSDSPTGFGSPYRAPWFLVDGSKADLDVGYIGDMIEESDDPQKLVASRFKLMADAAKSATSKDVSRLVVAARIVAFESQDASALRELDQASEAFAEQVSWES